ncbi:uncharacterized protein EI90DRAFT_3075072 [Cantharellus anzutake]|uniref:uncharacterized protein n=1 Tax=Cantharellus anzutake TaxID=1750568 RepID=UPI001907DA3B|nr:uncharacterized protein EI90DRAFT_3075072 [Cantharellus anzutake]KAF8324559.1 hypothetical protein EI90DRAFT_3075072 [Cantharellus anzutake]
MFKHTLLCFLLLITSVFALPSFEKRELRRVAPQLRARSDTNAKRLARGLPLLPPTLRRGASRTDSAKRAQNSDTRVWKGKIKVSSVVDQNTIGFLQLSGDKSRYIVGSASTADQFTATFFKQGVTSSVTFTDTNAPGSHPFLAGLISPGVEILASNSNAAIVGDAPVQTVPGSTPQSGGSVSIPGSQYETAIWDYTPSPPTAIPKWVNHDGSQPPISAVWDPVGQTLYLTANPSAVILNHPGSQTVEFAPIG